MNVLRIAWREWRANRWLPLAGLGVGLLILLVAGRLLRQAADPEARAMVAVFSGSLFTAITALVLGAGSLGRDLAEGRLGFFLDRPVGTGELFWGRLVGIALLSTLCGLLLAAPPLLGMRGALAGLPVLLGVFLFMALLGVLLGHAGSVAARAHSAWALLSLGGLALYAAGGALILRHLMREGAFDHLPGVFLVLLGALLPGLGLAGHLQLALGRADLKRGARALGLGLAPFLGAVLMGLFIWQARLLRVDPQRLGMTRVVAGGQGHWVLMEGAAPWTDKLWIRLLVDLRTGRHLRVPRTATLSWQGNRAAWLELDEADARVARLWAADLGEGRPRVRDLGPVALDGERFAELTLSRDGGTSALVSGRKLSFWDLESGKELRGFSLEAGEPSLMAFVEGGELRLNWGTEGGPRRMLAFGPDGTRRDLCTLDRAQVGPFVRLDAKGERMLGWTPRPDERNLLLDARTGERLAVLPGDAAYRCNVFLPDGRVACLERGKASARLHLLDARGVAQQVVDLDRPWTAILGESAPGRLMLASLRDGVTVTGELDLASGSTRVLEGRAVEQWVADLSLAGVGPAGMKIFRDGRNELQVRQEDGSFRALGRD